MEKKAQKMALEIFWAKHAGKKFDKIIELQHLNSIAITQIKSLIGNKDLKKLK